jgi:hypothetical protein
MIRLHSKPLNKTIEINRLIGSYRGKAGGPTIVITGGIHGNEPAGVFALKRVFEWLEKTGPDFHGNLFGISGNLSALEKGVRYDRFDLNRVWTHEQLAGLGDNKVLSVSDELTQQKEIYNLIRDIIEKEEGPFYFFDLHTTSGETVPFITVNDSLLNRKFTSQFPVPLILGIEEFLDGPLLSYINELGYIAFGFEGGQHDSAKAYQYCRSFIHLALVFAGCISRQEGLFDEHFNTLRQNMGFPPRFYEIFFRHEIKPGEHFKMRPGFKNFEKIRKGTHLADTKNGPLYAARSAHIFMPLYQGKGDDGYFLIKRTPKFFLKLSAIVRRLRLDRILVVLPGINWTSDKREELVVDLKVARFFTRQFLHLMGYRSKQKDATHLRAKNREAVARSEEYKNAPWNK